MFEYLQAIEDRLEPDQKDMLKRIYAPTVVGVPLSDARRDMCVLPNGEIRSYGVLYQKQAFLAGQGAYYSSVDGGISWVKRYAYGEMASCNYIAEADIYLSVADKFNILSDTFGAGKGLWVYRSKIGCGDENPEKIKVADGNYQNAFLPLKSVFSNRIWFTAEREQNPNNVAVFCYSDDWGKTWQTRELEVKDRFEMNYPHKGLRWCIFSGSEPSVVELSKNNLMMLLRSPHDSFYQSFSYDNGETWSEPKPSTFYGTNTTSFLLRLKDGRILVFWNNTKPLPEVDHKKTFPPVDSWILEGKGEDAFTNRDAAHVAISEDGGKTFFGYRELLLNPLRNRADFRYVGGVEDGYDKSVHQFQAIELPFNKVLVSAGQNPRARRTLIFDLDWLYETKREEHFIDGLENVSTHTYVKSVAGHTVWQAGNGHCAYNRKQSVCIVPHPSGNYKEAVQVQKQHDERLVSDISGIVWNFPSARKGKVSVEIKIVEKQARFVLTDRWYNPCDEYAAEFSPFAFELDALETGEDFALVEMEYDLNQATVQVFVNGKHVRAVSQVKACPTAISYFMLQCATKEDSKGFYVTSMKKE